MAETIKYQHLSSNSVCGRDSENTLNINENALQQPELHPKRPETHLALRIQTALQRLKKKLNNVEEDSRKTSGRYREDSLALALRNSREIPAKSR